MAAKEWKESFATYLKRNYKEGEKVVFDTTSEEILEKLKSDEENKKGQYNPKDELIDKPRFRLREEMANDPNHLEFKVWLQKQVEDSSLGKKSYRILWREKGHGPEDERDQAIDALYRLGDDYLSNLLESNLFNIDTSFAKGKNLRQLFLMDLIYIWDKIEKEQEKIDPKNMPWKDEKKFNPVDYVEDIKLLTFTTRDKSLMTWIYTDIIKVLIRECKIKNEGGKNEFEIPGNQFLKNLSDELEKTINRYRLEVISIYDKNKDKIHLDDHDKKQIDSLKSKGFAPLKNNTKTADSKNTNTSCVKLAYNILNELLDKNNDVLNIRKMSPEDYANHLGKADGSGATKNNAKSSYPHLLTFSDNFVDKIYDKKNAASEDLPAIFRWFCHERNRYMYCPPLLHEFSKSEIIKGGFLSKEIQDLITNNEIYEEFKTPKADPSEAIINAINILQNTQWEINLHLLETICDITLVEENGDTSLLKEKILDKKGYITDIRIKQDFKDAFLHLENTHPSNFERLTSLSYCKRIIEHNANVFWHTWISDFRGRIYTKSNQLSPQGSDIDKSLIRFKEWKKLGDDGLKWLYVFIHNLFNGVENKNWIGGTPVKRESFEAREAWVKKNVEQLRKIAQKPHLPSNKKILGLDKISKSKSESFQRLSSILELDRIWEEKEKNDIDFSEITTGLPIWLDASCNGFQHISTLVRNKELATLVNILPSKDDEIQDLYSDISDDAKSYYRNNKNNNLKKLFTNHFSKEEMELIEKEDYFFQRSLSKQPVVTTGYGSKDIVRALSGRSGGKGKPGHKIIDREWSNKDWSRKEDLPQEIKEGYANWKNKEKINYRYYQFADLSKQFYINKDKKTKKRNKNIKKRNKKYIKFWIDLLKDEKIVQIWAKDSHLYEKIVDSNKNTIGHKFDCWSEDIKTKEEFCKSQDKTKEELKELKKIKEELKNLYTLNSLTTRHLASIYKKSINKVTNSVFKEVIKCLKKAVLYDDEAEKSLPILTKTIKPAKWGKDYKEYREIMKHENIIKWELEDGFVVRNYYIDTFGNDTSGSGGPTKRNSSYSSIDPIWYTTVKRNEENNFSPEKSIKRIKSKIDNIPKLAFVFKEKSIKPIKSKIDNIPKKLAVFNLHFSKGNYWEELLSFLDKESKKDHKPEDLQSIREIERVLLRFNYSIPRYKESEDERLTQKKLNRILSSITPNFIHSLDAYHMRSIINEMDDKIENLSFLSVHDAFGTHACDMQKLIDTARDTFYNMHKDRDINWWLKQMRGKNAPQMEIDLSDWDSEKILNSKYMIY